MEFNDDSRVDAKAIEALPGVISVVERGGQFQIVVGNNVQQTFRALQKRSANRRANRATAKEQGQGRCLYADYQRDFDHLYAGDPGYYRCGMIKALLAILKLTGAISAASPTYHLLDTIADAAFFSCRCCWPMAPRSSLNVTLFWP